MTKHMPHTLDIIAPCFYPHIEAEHLKYFVGSSMHHGLMPRMYGLGKQYKDWIDTHITECLTVLRGVDSTHVLFTDACDVVFLKGMSEIENRYQRLGCPPMLVSVEKTGMNAGGWIGKKNVAIAILEHLSKAFYNFTGDPQERWREAIRQRQICVTQDDGNVIFQVASGGAEPLADTCLLHFAGGYTDPIVGKQEQIEPLWRSLGYER